MSPVSTTLLLLALCFFSCALATATEGARRAAQKVQASKPEMAANGLAAGLRAAMDPDSTNAWSPEEENLAVEILLKRVYKNRLHDGAMPTEICQAVSKLMLKNMPFVEAYRKSSGAPVTHAEKNRFLRIAVSTEMEVIRQGLENLRQQLGSVDAVVEQLRARKKDATAGTTPTRAQVNAEKTPSKRTELQWKLATHELYMQLTVLGDYIQIARILLGEGGATDPFKLGAKPLTVRLVVLALQRLYVKASYRNAQELFDNACRGVRYTAKDPKPKPSSPEEINLEKLIAALQDLIPPTPPTPSPTSSPTSPTSSPTTSPTSSPTPSDPAHSPSPSPAQSVPADGPVYAQELQEAAQGMLIDPESQTMQKFAVINLLQFAIPTIGSELLVAAETLSKALHDLVGPTPQQQAILVRKQTLIRRRWAYRLVRIIIVIHKTLPSPATAELHKLAKRLVALEQLPTRPKPADPATAATGKLLTGAGLALTEVPPIPPLRTDLLDIAKQLADALNAMVAGRTKDTLLDNAKAEAARIQEKIKAGLDPAALRAEVAPALTLIYQNIKSIKLMDVAPAPLPADLDSLLAAAQNLAKALKYLVPKKGKQQQQLQAPMEPVQLPAVSSDHLLNLAKQLAVALAKMVGPTPIATLAPATEPGAVAPINLDTLLQRAQQLANAMQKMVAKDEPAKPALATLAPAKELPAIADTAADFKAMLVSAQEVADALRKVAEPPVADIPQPTGPSQLTLAPVDEVKPTNFDNMLEASRKLAEAMKGMIGKVDTPAEGLDGQANRLMEIAVTLRAPRPTTA